MYKKFIIVIITLFFISILHSEEESKIGIYTKYPWLTDTDIQKREDLLIIKKVKEVGLSGATGGDYLSCPDFYTKYFMFFDLYGRFKSPSVGVYVEFWNDDTYVDEVNQNYLDYEWVTGHNTKLAITTITFSDPLKYIWYIDIGNLWLDYSIYSIAGKWQLQGISVAGDIDYLGRFHFFGVPLKNDGYVSGLHMGFTIPLLKKIKTDVDFNIVNSVYKEQLDKSYVNINNFRKNNNDIVVEGIITKRLNLLGREDYIKFDYASEKKEIYISNTVRRLNEFAAKGEIGFNNSIISGDVSVHYHSKNFGPPFKSYWRNYRLQRILKNNELGFNFSLTKVFHWFDVTLLSDITEDLNKIVNDNVHLIEIHYNLWGFNLYPRYEHRTIEELNGYKKTENIKQLDGYIKILENVGFNLRLKYNNIDENGAKYSNFEKWVLIEINLGSRSDLYFEAKVSDINKVESQDEYNEYWSQYDEFYWHFDNYLRVRLRLRW